jgi:hypothetical protein
MTRWIPAMAGLYEIARPAMAYDKRCFGATGDTLDGGNDDEPDQQRPHCPGY